MPIKKILSDAFKSIEANVANEIPISKNDSQSNNLQIIRNRLIEIRALTSSVGYSINLSELWTRGLIIAILRRYGIEPFHSDNNLEIGFFAPKRTVNEIILPVSRELHRVAYSYVTETLNSAICDIVFIDTSPPDIRKETSHSPDQLLFLELP